MMEVYREILPESYLLILAQEQHTLGSVPLAHALHRAGHSGKPSVWIDCSELQHLSPALWKLLLYYYQQFEQRGIHLVLCHVEPSIEQAFLEACPTLHPPMVPTLLDAAHYCHTRQFLRQPSSAWLPTIAPTTDRQFFA